MPWVVYWMGLRVCSTTDDSRDVAIQKFRDFLAENQRVAKKINVKVVLTDQHAIDYYDKNGRHLAAVIPR